MLTLSLSYRMYVVTQISADTSEALAERGHVLREQTSLGVVQAITWEGAVMNGAADPRKVERARTE